MITTSHDMRERLSKEHIQRMTIGISGAVGIALIVLLISKSLLAFVILLVALACAVTIICGFMRKSEENRIEKIAGIYAVYEQNGLSENYCQTFAEFFVNNTNQPANEYLIYLASLYRRLGKADMTNFYLERVDLKKISDEDKFFYCLEKLFYYGKANAWRDAVDFRNKNINFIQTYMQKKKDPSHCVTMYIALAIVDCASGKYADAFSLLNCGYKPKGANDVYFMNILITAVYVYFKMGDADNLNTAVENAWKYLRTFTRFRYTWEKADFERRINNAQIGIL